MKHQHNTKYFIVLFVWKNVFQQHKRGKFINNDSSIDRDFTFRFTVDEMYIDLDVHIAWADFTLYVDSPNPDNPDIIFNNAIKNP
ncbi:MAG: hypothetical protein LBC20_06505 [Planctomycetaceae bacterium]|jgi:hypothetical protein|nr:hypothetical protein [Planctomycetaceae bacterium]